jgi:hypothetical protein
MASEAGRRRVSRVPTGANQAGLKRSGMKWRALGGDKWRMEGPTSFRQQTAGHADDKRIEAGS